MNPLSFANQSPAIFFQYNAEIKMLGYPVYQVKIADISPTGAGIVVKEDSSFLSLLTVGRVLV